MYKTILACIEVACFVRISNIHRVLNISLIKSTRPFFGFPEPCYYCLLNDKSYSGSKQKAGLGVTSQLCRAVNLETEGPEFRFKSWPFLLLEIHVWMITLLIQSHLTKRSHGWIESSRALLCGVNFIKKTHNLFISKSGKKFRIKLGVAAKMI